jgi:hypothetical protein
MLVLRSCRRFVVVALAVWMEPEMTNTYILTYDQPGDFGGLYERIYHLTGKDDTSQTSPSNMIVRLIFKGCNNSFFLTVSLNFTIWFRNLHRSADYRDQSWSLIGIET